jgi:hypothetical protein
MKTLTTTVSAAALAFCLAAPAGAVDLRHNGFGDNMETTNLVITENGQSREFVLDYGMIEYNVCSSECTIQAQGGKPVTASGNDIVDISGSSAKVSKFESYAAAYPQLALLPAEENASNEADALAAPDGSVEGGGSDDGGQSDN